MSSEGRSPRARAGHDDDAAKDAAAFAAAVKGAKKLGGPNRVSPTFQDAGDRPGSARARVVVTASAASGARGSEKSPPLTVDDAGGVWTARADGVDRRVLRKLRARAIPVEARIDLHGLTRAKAAASLARFVASARAAGRRCLLVVHGRGLHSGDDGPALRDVVREQLTGEKHGVVLACAAAPDAWGGPGATIVYLRR